MKRNFPQLTYVLVGLLPIMFAGLFTLSTFGADNSRFYKQAFFIVLSLIVFFVFSRLDYRFLRRTPVVIGLYGASLILLLLLFILGHTVKGAQSWFEVGLFSFQPTDFAKITLIIILSKYFARRHVEIAHIKHILVSGVYALFPFLLVLIQPDFGNAIIIFFIWLGMVFVSGISRAHIALVFGGGAVAIAMMWLFVFAPYQKARIANFLNPLADVRGTGYNANQALIAVGSGQTLGKGLGYGTQSKLSFLPEYQTDFIFAAFAEEWGFVGVTLLMICFGIVLAQMLHSALLGASNFETLFALGLTIFFGVHIIINIGMNIGIMPVTGITLPFMSYGGSHILVECAALGMLVGMSRYGRVVHASGMSNEFLGLE